MQLLRLHFGSHELMVASRLVAMVQAVSDVFARLTPGSQKPTRVARKLAVEALEDVPVAGPILDICFKQEVA